MELVISKEEGKGYYLQHQEEEEVKMPSDEEKNVTHRCVDLFRIPFSGFSSAVILLSHDEGITVVILQGDAGTPDDTFQRIVGDVHR
jgi:hypothetical protein